MSSLDKVQSSKLFLLLLGLFLLLSQAACSLGQRTAVVQAAQAFNNELDETLEKPSELVFAGQIADDTGSWQNDYVVVLFKNGTELARTTSRLLNTSLSGKGPLDGVFELRTPNEYELTLTHEFYDSANNPLSMNYVPGLMGTRYIGRWLGALNPSDRRTFHVRDKQLTYSVVVLPMPVAELTAEYQQGSLRLEGETLVTNHVNAAASEQVVVPPTAVPPTAVPQPTPVPQSNVQLVVLPSKNNGQDWHLKMTGYYGNRWDVWEKYVAGRGLSMSWETFRYSVTVHNPHLESDNFVFYPEKVYLLPFN